MTDSSVPSDTTDDRYSGSRNRFFDLYVDLRNQTFGPMETPRKLYHYTDSHGLLGIVRNRELRLSNHRYSNDYAEVKHGVGIVAQIIRKLREINQVKVSSEADVFFTMLEDSVSSAPDNADPYIACFSELQSDLNQWRVYGREMGSYCIEFDAWEVQRALRNLRSLVFRVEYKFQDQLDFLKRFMAKIFETLNLSLDDPPADEARRAVVEDAAQQADAPITFEIARYKMADFGVEREWRAITTAWHTGASDGFDFRVTRFGVAPFLRVPLADKHDQLPITGIIAGPSRYPEHSAHALRELVRSLGLADKVVCQASNLPIQY